MRPANTRRVSLRLPPTLDHSLLHDQETAAACQLIPWVTARLSKLCPIDNLELGGVIGRGESEAEARFHVTESSVGVQHSPVTRSYRSTTRPLSGLPQPTRGGFCKMLLAQVPSPNAAGRALLVVYFHRVGLTVHSP